MNKKIHSFCLIIFIFITASLRASGYRVSVEISLNQEEIVNPLKDKQSAIKKFFRTIANPITALDQVYKQKLKSILEMLASNGLGKKGWGTLNQTNKPFHITLAYIDDLLDQKDLTEFKQVLEGAAQQIAVQFPNGLGDFCIQGVPEFIGDKGWIAYQNISDPYGKLKKVARIISDKLKAKTHHRINKDHPLFLAHVSIGLVGDMLYPPKAPQKTNPFYLQLLQNHAAKPHNSLLSGIQNAMVTKGLIDSKIKFNIKSFTLKIADLRNPDRIEHSEIIYELPSGLAAQLIILKSKLELLKSKLISLKEQLKKLTKQLIQ
ncbi:hypothetical protein JST56_02885 [Candidatus Dependentiae bacterium]|nr:hypothetical protein [Candidatus Dependentiae bacterium]